MRATIKLLASVKPGRFLEAGNPTGLTGLFTHPSPRSTLIALYTETLHKLESFPEHSVYRQSAEAITRHRLKIVEAVKPEGYEAWSGRARKRIEAHPELFPAAKDSSAGMSVHDGRIAINRDTSAETDDREIEWDGERMVATAEGVRTEDERAYQGLLGRDKSALKTNEEVAIWEPEPSLEAKQINEVETQIGGGLIEEVIAVAEGELELINTMSESKVWEDLEERPAPGQWEYFSRDQHTLPTQQPPVDKKS